MWLVVSVGAKSPSHLARNPEWTRGDLTTASGHPLHSMPSYGSLLDLLSCYASARNERATEKIIYSKTLAEPRSARTKIERSFDPNAVRRLKANAGLDIAVEGPELVSQAINARLVDEFLMIVCPFVVGSGKRLFPDGVRLELELVEQRPFRNGVMVLRYAVRGRSS